MNDLFAVKDVRNGNTQGPYDLRDALKLASALNDFIARNAGCRASFRVVPSTEKKIAARLCCESFLVWVRLEWWQVLLPSRLSLHLSSRAQSRP